MDVVDDIAAFFRRSKLPAEELSAEAVRRWPTATTLQLEGAARLAIRQLSEDTRVLRDYARTWEESDAARRRRPPSSGGAE